MLEIDFWVSKSMPKFIWNGFQNRCQSQPAVPLDNRQVQRRFTSVVEHFDGTRILVENQFSNPPGAIISRGMQGGVAGGLTEVDGCTQIDGIGAMVKKYFSDFGFVFPFIHPGQRC